MKGEKQLYFIALQPPEPVLGELQRLKEYFRDNYGSKASLNSPPHITLHMPFRYRPDREAQIEHALQEVVAHHSTFEIQLENFGVFSPRVIFVGVEKSKALLALRQSVVETCRKKLKIHNADYKDRGFHPHITLAFRDLKKAEFFRAWEEFAAKSFSESFMVDKVCLYRHDGKRWQLHHSSPLQTAQ